MATHSPVESPPVDLIVFHRSCSARREPIYTASLRPDTSRARFLRIDSDRTQSLLPAPEPQLYRARNRSYDRAACALHHETGRSSDHRYSALHSEDEKRSTISPASCRLIPRSPRPSYLGDPETLADTISTP